jgi:hypothetical protein
MMMMMMMMTMIIIIIMMRDDDDADFNANHEAFTCFLQVITKKYPDSKLPIHDFFLKAYGPVGR